jgi:hypothetical protein
MAKRGPGYPMFGLATAIERARQLYDQDGSAQTSPEVAVKAWGYGGLNGASLRVLAALRQYGLLEGAGDAVKLTHRALTILLEPPESRERAIAINEAVLSPDVFAAILAEYKDDLPSDAALVSFLVRKQSFQERPAQTLVEAFRESVALAKETPAPHFADNGARQAPTEKVTSAGTGAILVTGRAAGSVGPQEARGQAMAFSWPLAENQVVSLGFTRAPVAAEIATLEKYLQTVKEALGGAPPTPPESQKPESGEGSS